MSLEQILRALMMVSSLTTLCACVLPFDPALLDAGPRDAGAASPSCVDGSTGCAGQSCCARTMVPSGTFHRSFDLSDSALQPGVGVVAGWQPGGVASATLSTFELDVFEVSVSRFRRFVESFDAWRAAGSPGLSMARGWQADFGVRLPASAVALSEALRCEPGGETWSPSPGGAEGAPIACVTWYEAFAFCVWDGGGRLPTEAEWNYAAAGGAEQRAFPWSSPPASLEVDSRFAVAGNQNSFGPRAVGSRAPQDASRWGQHDLAGNVREWVLDYAPDEGETYSESSVAPPCLGCADLSMGVDRVRRGGAFDSDALRLRTAYRSRSSPGSRLSQQGFRCAR